MKTSDNISVYDLMFLNKRMYRCVIKVEDFEKEFINSLIKSAKFYTKGVKLIGSISESHNRDIILYFSHKQKIIFNRIKSKYQEAYDNRCAYYIYTQIIEDYEIKLEDYDRETLNSFKGEKETEESKRWIKAIILYN